MMTKNEKNLLKELVQKLENDSEIEKINKTYKI